MFGRNDNEFSTVSEFIEKKSKSLQRKKNIFFSKVDHVLHGEHEHQFSKQDALKLDKNTRCKVCGILLSEFLVQHKMDNFSPLLKPRSKQAVKTK